MAKRNHPYLFFLITVLFFTLLGCKSKKQNEIIIIPDAQKNHLQTARLKGKIKLITSTSFYTHHKDSISAENQMSTVINHYSSDGYINRVVTLGPNNDTVRVRDVEYNDMGKQIRWKELDYVNKTHSFSKFNYDMNGYISSEEYFSDDTLVYTIQYKTDGLGGITNLSKTKDNYTLRNQLQYNNLGLLIRNDEYDPNGKLFKYVIYEYDNYGDEVNRKVYRGSSSLVEFTYTQYDLKGRLLKIIYENLEHSLKEVRTYPTHDQKGNWTFEVFTANNDTIYFRKRDIIYY